MKTMAQVLRDYVVQGKSMVSAVCCGQTFTLRERCV